MVKRGIRRILKIPKAEEIIKLQTDLTIKKEEQKYSKKYEDDFQEESQKQNEIIDKQQEELKKQNEINKKEEEAKEEEEKKKQEEEELKNKNEGIIEEKFKEYQTNPSEFQQNLKEFFKDVEINDNEYDNEHNSVKIEPLLNINTEVLIDKAETVKEFNSNVKELMYNRNHNLAPQSYKKTIINNTTINNITINNTQDKILPNRNIKVCSNNRAKNPVVRNNCNVSSNRSVF